MPRGVLVTWAAFILVFAYGTGAHLVQLVAAGGAPYQSMPGWLAAYFVSLTVLDPVTAVLLACRRVEGLLLAILVLVTDAVANGLANYVFDDAGGVTAGRVGQGIITALAVAVLVAAPRLEPWFDGPAGAKRAVGVVRAQRGRR